MSNLWTKDDAGMYVDLISNLYKSDRDKWDTCINEIKTIKAEKRNEVSNDYYRKGDEYLKDECWEEAMEAYNKTLRFAPKTQNLGEVYGKRATCFFGMEKFYECLVDIELAKKAGYPINLTSTLEEQKKLCLVENWKKRKVPEPKLSYNPHVVFACMADVIKIKQDPVFGRHLVATSYIPAGQTVLVENSFTSSSQYPHEASCDTCHKTVKNFIACEKCTDVLFCTKSCQNQNSIHSKFCSTIFFRLPNNVKYVVKSILIAFEGFPNSQEFMQFVERVLTERDNASYSFLATKNSNWKYKFFLNLQHSILSEHEVEIVYKAYKFLLEIDHVKIWFHSKGSRQFLMHLIAEHVCVISKNSFEGFINGTSATATMANILSLFNHSCAPNVLHLSIGNKEVCITLLPVKQDGQLFISYLTNRNMTFQDRSKIIKDKWNFCCNCEKCVQTKWISDDNETFESDFKKLIDARKELDLQNKPPYAKLKERCTQFLNEYGHMPLSPNIDEILNLHTLCLLDEFDF